MHLLEMVYGIIFLAVIFLFPIVSLCVSLIPGRYYDKQFLIRHKPLPLVFAGFTTKRVMRGSYYLGLLLIDQNRFLNCRFWSKGSNKAKFAREWLPFNYREVARTRDWVVGFVWFSWMSTFLFCFCISVVIGIKIYFKI